MVYPDLVPVSAVRRTGLEALLEAIDEALQSRLLPVEALIPYDSGDVINLVHTHGIVDEEVYEEAGTRIVARVPSYLIGSLEAFVVETDPA